MTRKPDYDLLTLLDLLWNIEEFRMWHPQFHWTLAYVLDRLKTSDYYEEEFLKLEHLAAEKDYNEFAWTVEKLVVNIAENDNSIPASEKDRLKLELKLTEGLYRSGILRNYGIVLDKYVPDWFFALYGVYSELEDLKCKNAVIANCMDESGMTLEDAYNTYDRLKKNTSLLFEFSFYARTGKMVSRFPIKVCHYSAKMIADMTGLSPLGAYLYLIYIIENHEEALAKLEKGLVLKSPYEWE